MASKRGLKDKKFLFSAYHLLFNHFQFYDTFTSSTIFNDRIFNNVSLNNT